MKFIKVERGHYRSEDGRFILWALSGWYRGYWELVDGAHQTKSTHEGKRAAEAAAREAAAATARRVEEIAEHWGLLPAGDAAAAKARQGR